MQVRFGDSARLCVAVAIFLAISNQAFTDTKAKPVPLDWQPLKLKNGWAANADGSRDPAVAIDANNIVHLRGQVFQGGGTNQTMATLPSAYRPAGNVLVPIYVNGAHPGGLGISANGSVFVIAPNQADPQALTSLEGVSFPKDGPGVQ